MANNVLRKDAALYEHGLSGPTIRRWQVLDFPDRRLWPLSRVGGAGPKRQAWLGPAPVSGSSHPRSKRSPYPEGSDRAPRCHAPWGEFWRRIDVCRSSCRTFLSPVELRWRQPPAAPGGIANRSNRFAGEIYSPYLPQVSGSGSNTTHLDWEQLWPFTRSCLSPLFF